jgi:hypothetical protein
MCKGSTHNNLYTVSTEKIKCDIQCSTQSKNLNLSNLSNCAFLGNPINKVSWSEILHVGKVQRFLHLKKFSFFALPENTVLPWPQSLLCAMLIRNTADIASTMLRANVAHDGLCGHGRRHTADNWPRQWAPEEHGRQVDTAEGAPDTQHIWPHGTPLRARALQFFRFPPEGWHQNTAVWMWLCRVY